MKEVKTVISDNNDRNNNRICRACRACRAWWAMFWIPLIRFWTICGRHYFIFFTFSLCQCQCDENHFLFQFSYWHLSLPMWYEWRKERNGHCIDVSSKCIIMCSVFLGQFELEMEKKKKILFKENSQMNLIIYESWYMRLM